MDKLVSDEDPLRLTVVEELKELSEGDEIVEVGFVVSTVRVLVVLPVKALFPVAVTTIVCEPCDKAAVVRDHVLNAVPVFVGLLFAILSTVDDMDETVPPVKDEVPVSVGVVVAT